MIRTILKPLSFVPALLLMYMIFSFSAQEGDVSSQLSYQASVKIVEAADYVFQANLDYYQIDEWANKINFITRKLAHMTEYFALAVAVSFPLYVYGLHGILLMLLAGLICVGFACGDEYHQSFVAGRSPSTRDICIDSVGVFIGIILVRIVGWTGRKTIFRPRKEKVKVKKQKRRGLFGRKEYVDYDDPYSPQNGNYYQVPPQNGSYYQAPPQNGNYYQAPPQNGNYYQAPPQNGNYYQAPPQNGNYYQAPPAWTPEQDIHFDPNAQYQKEQELPPDESKDDDWGFSGPQVPPPYQEQNHTQQQTCQQVPPQYQQPPYQQAPPAYSEDDISDGSPKAKKKKRQKDWFFDL